MISFIQENYQQKLELEDIARHVHLCKVNAAVFSNDI